MGLNVPGKAPWQGPMASTTNGQRLYFVLLDSFWFPNCSYPVKFAILLWPSTISGPLLGHGTEGMFCSIRHDARLKKRPQLQLLVMFEGRSVLFSASI